MFASLKKGNKRLIFIDEKRSSDKYPREIHVKVPEGVGVLEAQVGMKFYENKVGHIRDGVKIGAFEFDKSLLARFIERSQTKSKNQDFINDCADNIDTHQAYIHRKMNNGSDLIMLIFMAIAVAIILYFC